MHRARSCQRQIQGSRLIAKPNEAVVQVERGRAVVFGIDDEREAGDVGVNAACKRVGQQGSPCPRAALSTANRPMRIAGTVGYLGSFLAVTSGTSARSTLVAANV